MWFHFGWVKSMPLKRLFWNLKRWQSAWILVSHNFPVHKRGQCSHFSRNRTTQITSRKQFFIVTYLTGPTLYKNEEESNDFHLFWCYIYVVWPNRYHINVVIMNSLFSNLGYMVCDCLKCCKFASEISYNEIIPGDFNRGDVVNQGSLIGPDSALELLWTGPRSVLR